MTPSDLDAFQAVFVSREPVLDRQQLLAGFEVAFQSDTGAAVDAVNAAFNEMGLGKALRGCRAFLRADAALLASGVIDSLPADMVVPQVDHHLLDDVDTRVLAMRLRQRGFSLCLSGLTRQAWPGDEVLALADFLKFDLAQVAPDDLQALTSDLKGVRRPIIATGIATHEHMELCALLGVELFQGYYFARLRASEGRALDPSVQAIFRLIGQIGSEAEIDELETTLRREPALIVSLLRLTNSVGVGARQRIASVRHAIAVLGRRQLLRWLQLLLFRSHGGGDIERNPLMQYAALRGRFMELLAARVLPGNARLTEAAFMTGLMSVLPAALNLEMREILTQMPVEDQVQLALLHHDGDLGALLALLDAYDANDPAAVSERLMPFAGATIGLLGEVLVVALGWVQALQNDRED